MKTGRVTLVGAAIVLALACRALPHNQPLSALDQAAVSTVSGEAVSDPWQGTAWEGYCAEKACREHRLQTLSSPPRCGNRWQNSRLRLWLLCWLGKMPCEHPCAEGPEEQADTATAEPSPRADQGLPAPSPAPRNVLPKTERPIPPLELQTPPSWDAPRAPDPPSPPAMPRNTLPKQVAPPAPRGESRADPESPTVSGSPLVSRYDVYDLLTSETQTLPDRVTSAAPITLPISCTPMAEISLLVR